MLSEFIVFATKNIPGFLKRLAKVDLSLASLSEANLTRANLSEAYLRHAKGLDILEDEAKSRGAII
jgi:uncharacterized protein YjbI with pentapeptide repeats